MASHNQVGKCIRDGKCPYLWVYVRSPSSATLYVQRSVMSAFRHSNRESGGGKRDRDEKRREREEEKEGEKEKEGKRRRERQRRMARLKTKI